LFTYFSPLEFFIRDGPLENLWGAKYKKKFSRKEKLNEKKIHARQLILKKYSCYGLKKSYKDFDNEKKFLRLENPPPP